MKFTTVFSAALLLLAESSVTSAKTFLHIPRGLSRSRRHEHIKHTWDARSVLSRRTPQAADTASSTGSNNASISSTFNDTISVACTSELSLIPNVTNHAGITACYNILQWDSAQGMFQADLRLYQQATPVDDFAGVGLSDLTVSLNYPPSTIFKSLMKRSPKTIFGRAAANLSEIQQYSLIGTFEQAVDAAKLNNTQLMSLMVPNITVNAVKADSKSSSALISTADTAYFVVGTFQNQFSAAAISPAAQASAIAASEDFQLPGMTFGIFPTGFIVTGFWTFVFLLAYGAGTIGRWRHRELYRKRRVAARGRLGAKAAV